jgi:GDP/UDP-N,N'-diacetylbacillosamine 2-epimerase (hydrolysing)
MTTLGIFTTSRAEFGQLSNLIEAIQIEPSMSYLLFAGGSHHLCGNGASFAEITKMGYSPIVFDFFLNTDSEKSLTQSLGIEMFQLSELFSHSDLDFVVVLGDRIEILPIIQAAIIFRTPIIHLHGGEVTEGALDEQVRHMITKSAHLHFCASEEYRQNIINMGEETWRVHNVGALGIDTIVKQSKLAKHKLFNIYNMDPALPTVLATYHPVTLEVEISTEDQILYLFQALRGLNIQILFTAPNVDPDNSVLFDVIKHESETNQKCFFTESMGIVNYQSMLQYVDFVIGNSSSGILEAPYFKIPTVNIGDRQKGRIRHASVIDVDYSVDSIRQGIQRALDPTFRESLSTMEYKFGDGHATERIVKVLNEVEINQNLLRKKLEFPNA